MAPKRIPFDQQAFVTDYVSGRFSLRHLAAKYGISVSLAGKIARGERRPEVAAMIQEALDANAGRVRRELARLQQTAIDALRKAMAGKPTSTSIAAAREVLNRTLPEKAAPDEPPAKPDPFERSLLDLSEETRHLVLKELGGPLE